jgi:glycosyltransferase involved in cell wall biosynthesis
VKDSSHGLMSGGLHAGVIAYFMIARSCGLPVLAAAGVGAGDELIEPGRNGLRFDNGDALALARQLEQLAQRPDLVRAMGAAGRQTVAAWSYEASMAQMQQALEGAPCSAL